MKKLLHFSLTLWLLFASKVLIAGSAPTSNFNVTPSTTVVPGTTVCFTDASTTALGSNAISGWAWTFNGQAPNYNATTAATANPPCITYNTPGNYQVCLTASNGQGTPTQFCRTISVVPPTNIGTANGTTISNMCGKYVYDNGANGAYTDNQNNTVTLCTGNTDYINVAFSLIDLAAGDIIQIYNGPNTSGQLITTVTSGSNATSPTIYANNSCITIRFISDGSGTAQGFYLQANCHKNIIMNMSNGTTISNACGYSIFDSGVNSNYSNNEYYTTTICASSATQVPQILFNSFQLGAGDQVNFYDGIGTTGQLIYSGIPSDNSNLAYLLGSILSGLQVSGISQCMTVEFISNGSTVSGGINGTISCKTPPTPCNSNPVAADNFDAATLICDFSQYCGVTSGFYGIDMPNISQSAIFNGSIENNSWLKFVADATTASFTVSTQSASCYIQIGIYSYNSSTGALTWHSQPAINNNFDYTNVNTGFAGTGTLNANGLVPGETYFVMIDGHGGSVCNYSLTAGIGVQLPVAQASPDLTLNCNQNGAISVTNTNGSTANVDWDWTWTGPSSGGPVAGSNLNLTGLAPGVYTYTVTATEFNNCVTTAIDDQVIVTVNPCPLPVELASLEALAKENFNEITWTTASENNSSYFLLERSTDLQNWEKIKQIASAGNSNGMLRYFAVDHTFENTINYYRLTQVDLDGTYTIYDVVSVDNNLSNTAIDRVINFMGQEVTLDTPGAKIILYKDGSSRKVMH